MRGEKWVGRSQRLGSRGQIRALEGGEREERRGLDGVKLRTYEDMRLRMSGGGQVVWNCVRVQHFPPPPTSLSLSLVSSPTLVSLPPHSILLVSL